MRRVAIAGGLEGMGAKYLPTIRDIKASQRFQQRQAGVTKQRKLSVAARPPKAQVAAPTTRR